MTVKQIRFVISIHALREESDYPVSSYGTEKKISIHALREESDWNAQQVQPSHDISIHALREESDRITSL